ncbi:MAG: LruC domain-containing protein [Bacteroidetes bacterium]|jgi:LruC domain-containing protein|nr:LruC domain-containing protein [Bacteroidota bacterium]MBT6687751.1 LruC domain-containing protein [Bacteroidota bacterium]MBT7143385.1 LruC domain-containing protein [Bacteroidota bacterium]MBT7490707.1 LruC domain-containing protein [Bacteroidota bacterium]
MKNIVKIGIIFLIFISLTFCKKESPTLNNPTNTVSMTELIIDPSFDFSNTKSVELEIIAELRNGHPLARIRLDILEHSENKSEGEIIHLFTGSTNIMGVLKKDIIIPSYVTQIKLRNEYLGLPDEIILPVINNRISYKYGDPINTAKGFTGTRSVSNNQSVTLSFMGTWDTDGVPDYLEATSDVISTYFLNDITNSLPESNSVLNHHPQYVSDTVETNLVISDSSAVYITFVHEGAYNKNTVGYYTYPSGSPPATPSNISEHIVIFPNLSFAGAGGGLQAGDKVLLDTFPANIEIGFFLIANGWDEPNDTVDNGSYILYTNDNLNTTANQEQHMVLLNDLERERYLAGFEDIKRYAPTCDHDFNDAVFYATVEEIVDDSIARLDPAQDCDNDGISDTLDDYPCDSLRAFDNVYTGTLAFEDLWPAYGDFDFNDLVVGYSINQITNAWNNVYEIEATWVVRAIGASYHNGFGIELPIAPSLIASVTGGVETVYGTNKAVILAFTDAYTILPGTGNGVVGVNTTIGELYSTPDTVVQRIILTHATSIANIGLPPYNPFIRIDGIVDKEVHLPDYPPTDLAVGNSYFGTLNDNSDPGEGIYYKSDLYLPWALHLPAEFDYPKEKSDINSAFLDFGSWAESRGVTNTQWYVNGVGSRNTSNIFTH